MVALRPTALERLRHLPNVRSVGVGLRVRGGQLTGELTFRVYVETKVPRAELAPADLIPETVEGIPTDVIRIGRGRKICWAKGTRPVVGGLEITESPFDTLSSASGTLGCMVTTADGKIAALSCEHVLQFRLHTDRRVYQPFYDECLGFQCNKIGVSVDGAEKHFDHEDTSFWIDCAMAVLDDGIGRRFRLRQVIQKVTSPPFEVTLPAGVEGKVWIEEEGGKVVAIEDETGALVDRTIIKEPAPALPGTIVWKVGNRSGLTAGIVEDPLGTVGDDTTGQDNNNVIIVRALAGYEVDERRQFADRGDSGSILLDLSNHVVGLVTGLFTFDNEDDDEEERIVYACNIEPVLAFLKATINVSPTPTGPSAALVATPEEDEEPAAVDLGERLHALEARVRATAAGSALIALIERHAVEAYDLVTRRRAVTVVWHRHRGPAFVALFARALNDPSGALPSAADGVPLRSMLSAMATALRQHGSAGLRADLDAHEPWILGLLDGGANVVEVLTRLDASPTMVS
jgi:hypothetical protein